MPRRKGAIGNTVTEHIGQGGDDIQVSSHHITRLTTFYQSNAWSIVLMISVAVTTKFGDISVGARFDVRSASFLPRIY